MCMLVLFSDETHSMVDKEWEWGRLIKIPIKKLG